MEEYKPLPLGRQNKNGNPVHRLTANPAGLSKLPVSRCPSKAGNRRMYCAIPYKESNVLSFIYDTS